MQPCVAWLPEPRWSCAEESHCAPGLAAFLTSFIEPENPEPTRTMSPTYPAIQHAVANRGTPPDDFLAALLAFGRTAPEEIFAENNRIDIYSALHGILGPWEGPRHRRAVMLEALRVLAGYESSWRWTEGVDTTNATSVHNTQAQETGVFQVSADSMACDASLRACVVAHAGAADAATFISAMKTNHALAIEYCARLLRFSVKWDGPILRGDLARSVSRAAVAEFEELLA
jgi:hypothetical protein